MKTSSNSVCDDDGSSCASPYHDPSKCSICQHEYHLNALRSDFRRDFCDIEDTIYSSSEDKINALFELEDIYEELHIDMDAILNKGESYLDY